VLCPLIEIILEGNRKRLEGFSDFNSSNNYGLEDWLCGVVVLRLFLGVRSVFEFHGMEKGNHEGWIWALEGVLVYGNAIRARL